MNANLEVLLHLFRREEHTFLRPVIPVAEFLAFGFCQKIAVKWVS